LGPLLIRKNDHKYQHPTHALLPASLASTQILHIIAHLFFALNKWHALKRARPPSWSKTAARIKPLPAAAEKRRPPRPEVRQLANPGGYPL
jgi:hypothetical protein